MYVYIVVGLAIAALAYILTRAIGAATTGRSKCATCLHCRKLFDDGTLCGYGSREVFKNQVHVENCMDYERK